MNEIQAGIIRSLYVDHQDQLRVMGIAAFDHPLTSPMVWVEQHRLEASPVAGEMCVGDTHRFSNFSNMEGEKVMVQLVGAVGSGATALMRSIINIYFEGETPSADSTDGAALAKILQLPEFLFGNIPLAHSQLGIYRHRGPYQEPRLPVKGRILAFGTVPFGDSSVLDVTLSAIGNVYLAK